MSDSGNDYCDPSQAQYVLRVVSDLDERSCAVTIKLWAINAATWINYPTKESE